MSSFELSPRQTFAANVFRLAREHFGSVLATLAGDPEEAGPHPAAENVHAARKELKRLRALLRLARAGLGEETFRRENLAARDAGRELSALRDAQVLVGAFDGLKGELYGRVAPATLEAVDGFLVAGVTAAAEALRSQDRVPRAVALLSAARERVDDWPWHGEEDGWSVPGRGFKAAYRAARRAMRRADTGGAETDFHEWRKQVKHLGAHVALLRPLAPGMVKSLGRDLDRLSERLGDEHDLAVLAATLAQAPAPAWSPADLAVMGRMVEERRATLRKKALRRGRRFFGERTWRFARGWRECWEEWRAAG